LCLAGIGGRKNCFVSTGLAQAQDWESSIRKFEEQDKINPPKLGCIVFTGSSSIARWETLVDEMKPLDVINRGFGGSRYSDLNQYAKRIVIACQPRAVVVYEGDNDLAAGSSKTPASVANDARVFVQTVHSALPEAWIYILSIKPSKARWNEWPKMKAANSVIRHFARTQERVQYIDVASAMFDNQGHLRADLFVEDGLHPNQKCYASWTSIIKPVLLQRFGLAEKVAQIPTELPLGVRAPTSNSWMLEPAV
jgi:lysophospholipase L1-like esterase